MNAATNAYAIFASNVIIGDLGVIVENATVGYPSYSVKDNSISFSSLDTQRREVVASVLLRANKIPAAGAPVLLITDVKWPVHFATGTRVLGLAPVCNFTADVRSGGALVQVRFIDLSINGPVAWRCSFPWGSPATSNLPNPIVNYDSPGSYAVTLAVSNAFGEHASTQNGFIVVADVTRTGNLSAQVISWYPNPATDVLYIRCETDFTWCLYNLQGRELIRLNNCREVNLGNLAKGMDVMDLRTADALLQWHIS